MRRAPLLSLAAAAALMVPATGAAAATVDRQPAPEAARTFATGAPGWTTAVTRGGLVCLPPIVCPTVAQGFHASGGAGGAGDGFIRTRAAQLAAVAGTATGIWRSPAFTPAGPVDRATVGLTLRSDVDGLIAVLPGVDLRVVLVDVADPDRSVTVLRRPLWDTAGFRRLSATLPAGAVLPGRSYRLELRTRLAAVAAVPLAVTTDFDDVELQLIDAEAPSGLTATVPAGAPRITGSVDPHGQATTVTVDYGPTDAYGDSAGPAVVGGDGPQPFTIPLADLTPGATYHYRVTAENLDGSIATTDATFVAGTPGTPGAPGTPGTGTAGGGPGSLSDPGGYAGVLGACYRSTIAITHVSTRGRRVTISGVSAFAPRTALTVRAVRGKRLGRTASRADGSFRATVRRPAGMRGKRARVRVFVGSARSNAAFIRPVNAVRALRVAGRTVTVRGRVDVKRLGKSLRFTARGGRGAAACAKGGRRLKVRRVRIDRRTGAYSLRVRVPAGSGRVAIRTRAFGRYTAYSTFGIR